MLTQTFFFFLSTENSWNHLILTFLKCWLKVLGDKCFLITQKVGNFEFVLKFGFWTFWNENSKICSHAQSLHSTLTLCMENLWTEYFITAVTKRKHYFICRKNRAKRLYWVEVESVTNTRNVNLLNILKFPLDIIPVVF